MINMAFTADAGRIKWSSVQREWKIGGHHTAAKPWQKVHEVRGAACGPMLDWRRSLWRDLGTCRQLASCPGSELEEVTSTSPRMAGLSSLGCLV